MTATIGGIMLWSFVLCVVLGLTALIVGLLLRVARRFIDISPHICGLIVGVAEFAVLGVGFAKKPWSAGAVLCIASIMAFKSMWKKQ